MLHQIVGHQSPHLPVSLLVIFDSPDFLATLHSLGDEATSLVDDHPFTEGQLRLDIWFELERIVVQQVELLPIVLGDTFPCLHAGHLENVVLCVHQDVHIAENVLLVD